MCAILDEGDNEGRMYKVRPAGYPSSSEYEHTSYCRAPGPDWDLLRFNFDPLAA